MMLTPEQKKAIKGLATEVSNSFTRIEAERDLIKNAIDDISSEHELDKKILTRLCIS